MSEVPMYLMMSLSVGTPLVCLRYCQPQGLYTISPYQRFASGRRGNTSKLFKDYGLKAKAIIWPWSSFMCHVRSTAAGPARCAAVPRRARI